MKVIAGAEEPIQTLVVPLIDALGKEAGCPITVPPEPSKSITQVVTAASLIKI